jgi:hypothetical protein
MSWCQTTVHCLFMSSWFMWRLSTKWYTVNSIWKHSVFAYPKGERYCFNRFCFEMVRQIKLLIELSWQPELARYFKTEPTDIVAFCFGISENTVFSNAIDSVPFVRWTPYQAVLAATTNNIGTKWEIGSKSAFSAHKTQYLQINRQNLSHCSSSSSAENVSVK